MIPVSAVRPGRGGTALFPQPSGVYGRCRPFGLLRFGLRLSGAGSAERNRGVRRFRRSVRSGFTLREAEVRGAAQSSRGRGISRVFPASARTKERLREYWKAARPGDQFREMSSALEVLRTLMLTGV